MSLTDFQKRALDEDGYLVLERFMDRELLDGLRRRVEELFAEEGDRAGAEFKQEPGARRLANCVDKGEIFQRVAATPRLLEYIGHVLSPEFKLSSMNVRSVNPHSPDAQPLHADM